LGAFIDDWKASVDVIQVHMWRFVITDILHFVMDHETRLSDACFDAPPEEQVFPKDSCLEDLALSPEHALVSLPALTIANQPGRAVRDPPMQPVCLDLFGGIVVLSRRVLCGEECMVESTGREQAATKAAQKAQSFRLIEPWADKTGSRMPA